MDYDAFGKQRSGSGSLSTGSERETKRNALYFAGHRFDPIANSYIAPFRAYSPSARGWMQTDQYLNPLDDLGLSLDPTTGQRTLYAGGNPVNMIDEDGHSFLSVIKKAAHAVSAAAHAVISRPASHPVAASASHPTSHPARGTSHPSSSGSAHSSTAKSSGNSNKPPSKVTKAAGIFWDAVGGASAGARYAPGGVVAVVAAAGWGAVGCGSRCAAEFAGGVVASGEATTAGIAGCAEFGPWIAGACGVAGAVGGGQLGPHVVDAGLGVGPAIHRHVTPIKNGPMRGYPYIH